MVEPNFLGIGAQKSGTSWLDMILRTHAQIYLPESEKEVHFFDRNFDRGPDWYEKKFVNAKTAKAIGEITPYYLPFESAAERIYHLYPNCKFLVMLRNPVERAQSHFKMFCANSSKIVEFENAISSRPSILRFGLYADHLQQYFSLFPRQNFLIDFYDNVFENPTAYLLNVAEFLDVSPTGFDLAKIDNRVNEGGVPKAKKMHHLKRTIRNYLRDHNQDFLLETLKRFNTPQKKSNRQADIITLPEETRDFLSEYYGQSIVDLEVMLDTDLSHWKNRP